MQHEALTAFGLRTAQAVDSPFSNEGTRMLSHAVTAEEVLAAGSMNTRCARYLPGAHSQCTINTAMIGDGITPLDGCDSGLAMDGRATSAWFLF